MEPVDPVVLHEHPEWQKPLFEALPQRGVRFAPFDVTRTAFANDDVPAARLYFNQVSPSAYIAPNANACAQPLDQRGMSEPLDSVW